ncbi:hypothetical protein BDW74DRAFT_80295 [Aspergillus multicolor]|uniref:uncharacterized protein n=1 Tax=Aspergillus multicolor TaxID=41759 RepID=UPI003CCDDE83
MDSLKEAIPAEKIDKQFAPPFHSIDPTVPGSTTFYLPLGLVISLFCMRFFNSKQTTHVSQIPQASFATMFIVLLLAAYIFATFTLWFLREEDWVKRVIGSWKLANPTPKSSQQEQSRDSRLPDILRRRKALETS